MALCLQLSAGVSTWPGPCACSSLSTVSGNFCVFRSAPWPSNAAVLSTLSMALLIQFDGPLLYATAKEQLYAVHR